MYQLKSFDSDPPDLKEAEGQIIKDEKYF